MFIDFFLCPCDRVGKEVMGEHQMEYVQLTQDVAYYLEHMEVLFLQEARHRFEATVSCLPIYALMIYGNIFISHAVT